MYFFGGDNMGDGKISDNIITIMSKNVFRFSEYWYSNYIVKSLTKKAEDRTIYIEKYRGPIVSTITNGIKAIDSKRIDADSYLKMGRDHFYLGLSLVEMEKNQVLMEQAIFDFLQIEKNQNNAAITDKEITDYLLEFRQLNNTVTPLIIEGYLEAAEESKLER